MLKLVVRAFARFKDLSLAKSDDSGYLGGGGAYDPTSPNGHRECDEMHGDGGEETSIHRSAVTRPEARISTLIERDWRSSRR